MVKTLSIILLFIYTLFVIYVGIKNSKSKNSTDYFLASRNLPSWLLAITFIASWWGGGSAIDLVDQAYKIGMSSFWIYGIPVLISTAIMFFLAKRIRETNLISQPEIFTSRYNKTAGFILTIFILSFMIIGASVQVIVIGHFFQSFFEISYISGTIIGTSIVLFYSMFGGFRGVVLTDLLQFCFFLIGGLSLFLLTYYQSGGIKIVQEHSISIGKLEYTSFWKNASNYIAYILTFGTSWAIQANIWQRISAARNNKSARKMMLISFIAFIPLYLMVTYTGMFSSVLFEEIPKGGIVPQLIRNLNNPFISAFIFVGLCSAIMSTMDSMFNTAALSLTIDIYKKHVNSDSSPNRYVFIGRIATFLVAILALIIGVNIESVLTISWISSDFLATGAFVPIIAMFVLKKCSSKAAIISMLFGLSFSLYNLIAALGVPIPIFWEIASASQALIGMIISLILYTSISYFDLKRNKFIKALHE